MPSELTYQIIGSKVPVKEWDMSIHRMLASRYLELGFLPYTPENERLEPKHEALFQMYSVFRHACSGSSLLLVFRGVGIL